jgi:hypothetical protein
MPRRRRRIFLLSPARLDGRRAQIALNPRATFELAMKLRAPAGAAIGETFSFLSGLYFRGKLAYARRFAPAKAGSYVITTDRGLIDPETPISAEDLRNMAAVPICPDEERYRLPLERAARQMCQRQNGCDVVLLGSVASRKYVDILLEVFGARLLFPHEFIGRGDMSRGGLLLRCVDEGAELTYVPVSGAIRHGARPPKLAPRINSVAAPQQQAR